jgi:hypothetical protein
MKTKVLRLNLIFVIDYQFQLNISCAGHHFIKREFESTREGKML